MNKIVIDRRKALFVFESLVGLAMSNENKTLDITKGFLIEPIGENKMLISAVSLPTYASIELECKSTVSEKICCDAKILFDFCKLAEGEELEMELIDSGNIILKCGSAEMKLSTLIVGNFPSFKTDDSEFIDINLPLLMFNKALNHTIFAASNEDARPNLTCINFKTNISDSSFFAAAMDGFRLAILGQINENLANLDSDIECNIDKNTLKKIIDILPKKSDSNITISIGKRNFMIKLPGYEIKSLFTEGEYIKYEGLMPEDYSAQIIVSRSELINAVSITNLVKNENNRLVPLNLQITDGKMILEAIGQSGKVSREVNLLNQTGGNINVCYNPYYLIEGLKVIEKDEIHICFSSVEKHQNAIIGPADQKDYNFLYMILPVSRH